MKPVFLMLLVAALAGCATNKAVVPSLEGKPRVKINASVPAAATTTAGTFDFKFSGDIVDSLAALRAVQPQLNVMPALGKPFALPVQVDLHGATLDDALRSIGEQGGDAVDVVLNKSEHQGGNQVFIRFNNPKE